jgi:hypothetical protein
MTDLEALRAQMAGIGRELQAAVDVSIELRARSPQQKDEVIKIWEEFLGGFWGYLKRRSREAKDNLLAGVSLTKMKLF